MSGMPEPLGFGCDVGTKRLGIALGGPRWVAPRPLGTLPLRSGLPPWPDLDRLVKRYQPSYFVFGLTTRLDGSAGLVNRLVQRLADEVVSRYRVETYFVDEAFSTEEGRHLHKEGTRRRGPWSDPDAAAACIIMATWLGARAAQHDPSS